MSEREQRELPELREELERTHAVEWSHERRNGTVTLLRPRDGSEGGTASIVLKELAGDLYTPDALHDLMLTLAEVPDGGPPIGPRPRAFGTDPPFVAYEWVDGVIMNDALIAAFRHRPLAEGVTVVTDLAAGAGRLLHRFHTLATGAAEETSIFRPESFDLLDRSLRLTGTSLPDRSRWVRALMDPGPHNIVVEPSGDLRLLDLPGLVEHRPAEVELGMMAQRVGRRSRLAARAAGVPVRGVARAAADATIAAYRSDADGLDDALIEAAVAVSAGRLARKFWKKTPTLTGRRDSSSDAAWLLAALWRARRLSG